MMIRIWYERQLDIHGFSGEFHSEILKHTVPPYHLEEFGSIETWSLPNINL